MCIFVPCGFCLSARKELKMNKKEPVVLNSEVEMSKTLQIRNSTIDFLVFTKQNSQDSIEVRVQDENVWLAQDGISRLFDVDRSVVTKHLKNVFETNELEEISVCAKFAHTAADGKTYNTKFYNLDAIISVGYRVNSIRATQFRQWATNVLRNFAIKGYVLDKQRLENGQIFDEEYFENLLEEIREIRMSERKFYQKITDIYATSVDYSRDAVTTRDFFANVQNKLHWAIHRHTAAELIMERADAKKTHMGLTTWRKAPDGKIEKSDVSIAKNYLSKDELHQLERFVTMYLDYAEFQAKRQIPMTMEDWALRLNKFLDFNEVEILTDKGRVSAEIAKAFAESEFEKYRVVQDKLFKSDFDKFLNEAKAIEEKK